MLWVFHPIVVMIMVSSVYRIINFFSVSVSVCLHIRKFSSKTEIQN